MVSRTLRTNLLVSLALIAACSGDDEPSDTSTTFPSDDEIDTTAEEAPDAEESADSNSESGETMGDGDGDTADTSDTNDTDPTESTDETADDTTDDATETTGMECLDLDQDGYGDNCDLGPDCDDADFNNHTDEGCANCADADLDNYWVGCDTFDDSKPGPDCNDADFNVFSDLGCANCVDGDNDGFWKGCDQYGDAKPGPDCNDANGGVGIGDNQELCNGIAENCAGEIDNAPPDEMCPADGNDPPGVAPMNGWACNPPAPGVDGCEIANCVEQFFDLDEQLPNGCECEATPRTESLAACSDAPQGYLGSAGEGSQLNGLVIGSVPLIDNGIGAGAEDWFSVEFPEAGNPGTRPNTGSIRVDFAVNTNNDYRFQVFRTCNSVAFDSGLATQFGGGAPPAREWWFFDNHAAPVDMPVPALYDDDVNWPSKVYIRVFRVQNDKTCNDYQLRIQRVSN